MNHQANPPVARPLAGFAVATAADCRRRGYASALIAHITKELLSGGKTPCIACDNPAALSVYQGCGFEETDCMTVRDLRRQPLST